MFCPTCGNWLPADAAFCNQCGSKLPTIQTLPPGQGQQGRITVKFDDSEQLDATVRRSRLSSSLPPTTVPQSTGPVGSSSLPLSLPPTSYSPPISGDAWPQYQHTSEPGRALQPIYPVQRLPQAIAPSQLLPPPVAPPMPPLSGLQRFLIGVFQPALAGNPLLGVTLGGVLAAIGGTVVAGLLLNIAHAVMHASVREGFPATAEMRADTLLGLVQLQVPWRESLQLFLVMHSVGIHTVYSDGSSTSVFNTFAPLHGFLLVPALFLVLGGYVAASTDFSSRVQTGLLRGAAIAIPYTVALFIIALQVNGPIPDANGGFSQNTPILNMDLLTLLIFGLLWGALFGVLGASLKVARGHWRRMIYYFVYTNRHPQLVGMIAGGLAATGLGVALSLLVVYCFVAYTSYSHPFLANILCTATDWQALTLWSIVRGPLHAVNLFAVSFGAPVTISNQFVGEGSCFYAYSPHTVFALFGTNVHPPFWFYALLLIPAISLFLGGRVSVVASRVQGNGPGAVQGLLIAAPFTLLMILLTLISTVSFTYTTAATSSSSSPIVQSAGVATFDLLLWALVSSAVLGALGGMYQTSTGKSAISKVLAALAFPIAWLCSPFFFVLDRLTGQPRSYERSRARSLFYGAFLCVLLLAIGSLVAGASLINMNQVLTYTDNQRILNIFSVLLIAIPGLLLLGATASALAANPFVQSQQPRRVSPSMPMPRFQGEV